MISLNVEVSEPPLRSGDRSLSEYFRCPARLSALTTSKRLRSDEGFFRFGDAIGYGRCDGALGRSVTDLLPDVSALVTCENNHLRLPFDLSEVVTNLRRERYGRSSDGIVTRVAASAASRSLYYFLRPMLSVGVRKHLQRIRLRDWNRIPFPHWPVDFTVEQLMGNVMRLILKNTGASRIPFIWFWPDGAPSAGILTHDVETPAGQAFSDQLMDIDDSFGFKSAFQVVPEIRSHAPGAFLKHLRSRGFEGNVHDLNHDGNLFRDRKQFQQRASSINRYLRQFDAVGFRAGAMHREQDWFDALDVSFDMSVPNVAHLEPQRGGCCTVMPYFVGNLVELPLTTIQDYSLFHILGDYSIALWREQIDSILSRNGLISILTHPDYLIEKRARAVYVELLSHLRRLRDEGKVWFALPGELNRWWRNRELMTLVADGDSWIIEGPDSDRARVAYATLEDDRLVYELDELS